MRSATYSPLPQTLRRIDAAGTPPGGGGGDQCNQQGQPGGAEVLGISPNGVRKRARRGALLALPRGKQQVFPAFQFDLDDRRVVPGLAEVLPLLDTESAAAKLRFFLLPEADLGGTPLALLRDGDAQARALVERRARQFGRQLAA
jgi:hypothetical protein